MWRMTEQLPAEGSIISQISLFAFAKFRCHSGLSAKPQPTISQLVTHGTAMASGLPASKQDGKLVKYNLVREQIDFFSSEFSEADGIHFAEHHYFQTRNCVHSQIESSMLLVLWATILTYGL